MNVNEKAFLKALELRRAELLAASKDAVEEKIAERANKAGHNKAGHNRARRRKSMAIVSSMMRKAKKAERLAGVEPMDFDL